MPGEKSGFSLIEVLISVVIMGLLVLGTAGMIAQSHNSFKLNRDESASFADANAAMMMMIREIRQSTNVTRDSLTQITLTCGGDTIVYSLSGSNLKRKQGSATHILAGNVTDLKFTQNSSGSGSGIIVIDLTVNNNGRIITLRDSVTPRSMGL